MILGVEVVDGKADPARAENENWADDLSYEGNRLFDDVEDCDDRENDTDNVNKWAHRSIYLKKSYEAKLTNNTPKIKMIVPYDTRTYPPSFFFMEDMA